MTEIEVVVDTVSRLDTLGIPYMITGSFALNVYTTPRMTRDADIVVALKLRDIGPLVDSFEADYYVSQQAADEAVRHELLFNAIHRETLFKIDFVVQKKSPYRQAEFERRVEREIDRHRMFVVSKEDLIISKLLWARDHGSEVQLRDARSLLRTGYDADYLQRWLTELDLTAFANRLVDDA